MSLHDPGEFDIPPRPVVLAGLLLLSLLIVCVSLWEFATGRRR